MTGTGFNMSRVPVWAAALIALLLAACGETDAPEGDEARSGARFLMGGEQTAGFARATERRALIFPEDHGSHPDYRTEWWYFTGNLFTTSGRHFGFELTFFRFALAAGEAPERASAWATRQAWMAHFALTDTAGARFFAHERMARGAMGLAGAEAAPFRVWVKDWSAEGSAEGIPPLRLSASTADSAIELELEGLKPMVLHGDAGLDRKGPEPGNASYYYTFPRLAARGTVRSGDTREQVEGLAWMDREWSTSLLGTDIAGWDWFSIQLDDGRDLMFYQLRRHDGTATEYSGGSLVDEQGQRQALDADDVELEVVRHWRSADTGRTYPVEWRMTVPREELRLHIEPYLDEQEVDLFVRYWEGAMRVNGTARGETVGGNGYLELAGY